MKFETLGNIAKIQIGKTPSRANLKYWGKGNKWVSISDLNKEIISTTKEEITDIAVKECGCKLIPKGTLLMSFKLSIGKLAFAGENLYTNEAICGILIKEKNKYTAKYIYYALQNINLIGSNVAAKGLTLNTASLNALRIPIVGDINYQIIIADLLSKSENLIKQRKESISLLDDFLKSTFSEMFGDPVRNEKGLKFVELEKLCSEIVDCPHSTPVKADRVTNYPCIRTSELKNGYIFWDSMQYLNEIEYLQRIQRLTPSEGDIVYGREGSYGEAIRIPGTHKFSLGQRTMLLRPDYSKCNSIFLWAMVRSDFVYMQAKKKNSGSTVGHVNVKDIRKFKVLHPPMELQTRFAKIVEKIEILKVQYQSSLNELENLYGSLSQLAFKGELDLSKIQKLRDEKDEEHFNLEQQQDHRNQAIDFELYQETHSPFQNVKNIVATVTNYEPVFEDVLPFITEKFQDKFFTFEDLKKATIKESWKCDFETLKTFVFDLLREKRLRQVFADATFKSEIKKDSPSFRLAKDLEEKMYLQRIIS